ncbi:MAG: flagellar basal body rod protein FlgB [Nitrospirae bacterium]|nr:flagellar basal body rod protein FlgB [Nitrospirota bacterium]
MDSGFSILEKLIQATQVRHKVLSSNIANVDTPKYRAKDVDFKSFLESENAGMKTTNPGHISTSPVSTGQPADLKAGGNLSWGDDNNVELDMEVAKMTENGLLYEAAARLLSKKMLMIKSAANRR